MLFFNCYAYHRDLHSFPTRRSSDLGCGRSRTRCSPRLLKATNAPRLTSCSTVSMPCGSCAATPWRALPGTVRSEEHTSELQSRRDLVCRLLLEKKKKKSNTAHTMTT